MTVWMSLRSFSDWIRSLWSSQRRKAALLVQLRVLHKAHLEAPEDAEIKGHLDAVINTITEEK